MLRLRAAAVVAVVVTAFAMGPADPASATSVLIYPANGTFSHNCRVLGGDGMTEAVFCADLATMWEFNLSVPDLYVLDLTEKAEVFCQPVGGGTAHQCAGIKVTAGLYANSSATELVDHIAAVCGAYYGQPPCPASGRFIISRLGWEEPTFLGPTSHGCEEFLYATDYWVSVTSTVVRLPGSGTFVQSPPNVASNHISQLCH